MFGDSFGDGIWWALDQQFDGEDGIEVHRLSRPATGFTSYQNVNLLDDIRAKLDRQPLDIAIVSFGANDTQGIIARGPPGRFYERDLAARDRRAGRRDRHPAAQPRRPGLLGRPAADALASATTQKAQRMNAFFAGRMRALGVPFIDTVATDQDAHGRFAASSAQSRRPAGSMPARTSDGIHMTMNGYTFLTHAPRPAHPQSGRAPRAGRRRGPRCARPRARAPARAGSRG